MDITWELPDEGYIKINVHCEVLPEPLANGNSIGVGVIARDDAGANVWTASGPMNGLNEEQALMAGIQAACVESVHKKWEKTLIETSNHNTFETISTQEHVFLRDDQLEPFRLFNTVHANHFKVNTTNRKIIWIPTEMNSTARYLADYGLQHLSVFAETPGWFGDLKYHVDRDMGMVLQAPIDEVAPNFGLGEVEDGPPPAPTLKRKRDVSHATLAGLRARKLRRSASI
ncbi:hypothetical protein ACET3Z_012768 [Daucus carota]